MTTEIAAEATSKGRLFRNRNFQFLTFGQGASTLGDYCYAVALPWLILSHRNGTLLLSAVLACYGIPRTAAILPGGWLSDRFGARSVMLIADTARLIAIGGLAFMVSQDVVNITVLESIAVVAGMGEGLFMPSSSAIIPVLVHHDDVQTGNALNSGILQAGAIVGPGLGGALVGAGGSVIAFAVDAATFAISAVTLSLMRITRHPPKNSLAEPDRPTGNPAKPKGTPAQAKDERGAWKLLRTERVMQVAVAVNLMANLVSGATFEVALPALSHARYGADGYGAILACLSAGAMIGAIIAGRRTSVRYPAVLACASYLLQSASQASLPFLGGLVGAACGSFVLGVFISFGGVIMATLIQKWAPPSRLGSVMSLLMFTSIGCFPISVALGGLIIHHIGPALFFPISGGMVALAIIGALSQNEFRTLGRSSLCTPVCQRKSAYRTPRDSLHQRTEL